MPQITPEDLIDRAANDSMNLSLKEVLHGAMEQLGGPRQLGETIGNLISDNNVNITSRVSLMNNFMKLLASLSADQPKEEFSEEEIKAELDSLK